MPGVRHENASEKTDGGICRHCKDIAGMEKKVVLMCECRESGETSTESHREEKLHIGIDIQSAVSQTIYNSDEQTPGHIDGKRAQGEKGLKVLLDGL